MDLIELTLIELRRHTTVTPDVELGYRAAQVDGTVDVGALMALVLERAADVVNAARHIGTVENGGKVATPMEAAHELKRQAKDHRETFPNAV
jgi:hypothetical protein